MPACVAEFNVIPNAVSLQPERGVETVLSLCTKKLVSLLKNTTKLGLAKYLPHLSFFGYITACKVWTLEGQTGRISARLGSS